MQNFNILYAFHSPEIDVLEIKRTDLKPDAPLSEIYNWLAIFKHQKEVLKLGFKSMFKDSRNFEQGHISFDEQKASFSMLRREWTLQRITPDEVSEDIRKLIEIHLRD